MTRDESEKLQHCCAPFKHYSAQDDFFEAGQTGIHGFKQCYPKVDRNSISHKNSEQACTHHMHAHTRLRSKDP